MKKIFTLISALGMMLASSLQAQEKNYEWAEDIVRLNPEVVDSVIPIGLDNPIPHTESCMIYYHQPLQHDNPSLGTINLRAIFVVYALSSQYRDVMVQMSIGGYDLKEIELNDPNGIPTRNFNSSAGEISFHYEGHLLRPEHRFFGSSVPENPMENIEYCNAKEAAADFHALAEAVKKSSRVSGLSVA